MQRKYTAPTGAASGADGAAMINLQIAARTSHSLDALWQAVVVPEKLAAWMRPVTGQFSKGGAINLGDGTRATITACEPKRRLTLSLAQGALTQGVAISFGEEGKGRAKQRLLRLNISANRSGVPDSAWAAYGPASLGIAWELTCRALLAHLDNPEDKPDVVAYARRPDAVAAVNEAYAEWRAQAVAQGAEEGFMPLVPQQVLNYYNGLYK